MANRRDREDLPRQRHRTAVVVFLDVDTHDEDPGTLDLVAERMVRQALGVRTAMLADVTEIALTGTAFNRDHVSWAGRVVEVKALGFAMHGHLDVVPTGKAWEHLDREAPDA